MLVPLTAIQKAQERLRPHLSPSPVRKAESYSRKLEANVVFKLEQFQPTGAFKVRGALNAVLCLSSEARERGVITASAGNHGLGLAYAARAVGVSACVVLPESTPTIRIDTIRQLGSTVIVHGEDWNAANARALDMVERQGLTYVSPFDDPAIMAGQGTIALEVLEQVPEVDVIVCSVGGGGLISGIASAVKQRKPDVRVIGVETRGADCMAQSLQAGRIVELPQFSSIAQSLGTKRSTERQLSIVQEAVERVEVVSDEGALQDLLNILNYEKLLVEPAASCALTVLTHGCVPDIRGKTIVPIICGANITLEHVQAWLKRFRMDATGQLVS